MKIDIIDLTLENIEKFYPEHYKAKELRRTWLRKMMQKGLRRKFAYDENGQDIGELAYMPVEEALDCVDGKNVNVLHCSYILGEMIGNPNRCCAGRELLKATEEESRVQGRGVALTWWRPRDFLLELGYKLIDERPPNVLLLKAFAPNQRVWYLEKNIPQVELVEGKVVVDVYWNLWCASCYYGYQGLEAVRQAVAELGESVLLREHEMDRSEIKRFGTGMNLILINGIDVSYIGPPPSKEWVLDTIRKAAENQYSH